MKKKSSTFLYWKRYTLPKYLREMKKLNIGGFSSGNEISLIVDGSDCYRQFYEAIENARSSINLETYIFRSDEAGWDIAGRLVDAVGRGVEVNLVYDAIGSIKTSRSIFSFMRTAGVEVIEYHPIFPWRKFWNITLRDHRKILVVDGKSAFIGGLNIGNEYAGNMYTEEYQRDTHVRITGPAVRDIQFFFMENWFRNGGSVVDYSRHFPHMKKTGSKMLMVLCTKSRRNVRPIHFSYLSAIDSARDTILLANAYFIPDQKIYRSLVSAAKRGVSVRIMLPSRYVMPIVKNAVRYLYRRYLRHGIELYEYEGAVLHVKSAVIDGVWSMVGSSNLDRLSYRINLELNAVILDEKFGDRMIKVFDDDLKLCKKIELESIKKRSFGRLFLEWLSYRFRNIL
ncbi:MAG: phospholipase D-like domain-containing protein [Spirochaetes bacterium]|jgi:cardiolipin synthase|nr:phospholipase D-like domain-containing protein [Spirochaetota bacterium]